MNMLFIVSAKHCKQPKTKTNSNLNLPLVFLNSPLDKKEPKQECLSSTFSSVLTTYAKNMTNMTLINNVNSTPMVMMDSLVSTLPLTPPFNKLSMFYSIPSLFFLSLFSSCLIMQSFESSGLKKC